MIFLRKLLEMMKKAEEQGRCFQKKVRPFSVELWTEMVIVGNGSIPLDLTRLHRAQRV